MAENKYNPKTKEEFNAYVKAMDAANATFEKPPVKKSGKKTASTKATGSKKGKK